MTLDVANELRLYGEQYAWFAGTKVFQSNLFVASILKFLTSG